MNPDVNFKNVIIDKLYLKYLMKEKQVLLNKTGTDLNMDLKIAGYENHMEKDATLDIQSFKRLNYSLMKEKSVEGDRWQIQLISLRLQASNFACFFATCNSGI